MKQIVNLQMPQTIIFRNVSCNYQKREMMMKSRCQRKKREEIGIKRLTVQKFNSWMLDLKAAPKDFSCK